METAALFIGVFGFLSVCVWAAARASERKAQARYALLAKIAEQPADSAKLVIEFFREDEARRERARAVRSRRDLIQGSLVIIAVGTLLSVALHFLFIHEPKPIWPFGLLLAFFGLALFGFAYFNKAKA